eukprot:4959537-Amphidinium_carterae.1
MNPSVDLGGVRFGTPIDEPPAWEGKMVASILRGVPDVLAWVPPGIPVGAILPAPKRVARSPHVAAAPIASPSRKKGRRKFAAQWDQGHALRERAIGKWHLLFTRTPLATEVGQSLAADGDCADYDVAFQKVLSDTLSGKSTSTLLKR